MPWREFNKFMMRSAADRDDSLNESGLRTGALAGAGYRPESAVGIKGALIRCGAER